MARKRRAGVTSEKEEPAGQVSVMGQWGPKSTKDPLGCLSGDKICCGQGRMDLSYFGGREAGPRSPQAAAVQAPLI